ncbi:MAG: nucleotidyltransferase domain-containing protein [Actinomycetota bacterium]|nr:nucleotidyltransferase domain-containing protein [Actinomycetota bacterium]
MGADASLVRSMREYQGVLDSALLDRLGEALDQPGVVLASLFGSQVAGKPGPLSDVDVAVWLDPGLQASERLDARLRLLTAAEGVLGERSVDLVVLNDAPPLLQNRASRGRLKLVERDPRARVRLESEALIRFLDTEPLRAELATGLSRRLEEGRFGRP